MEYSWPWCACTWSALAIKLGYTDIMPIEISCPELIIAAKKMEQDIMNVIPVLMLGYLNLTAKDFLEPLYGNLFGVCVMTIALVCYLGAIFLAGRITDIKV